MVVYHFLETPQLSTGVSKISIGCVAISIRYSLGGGVTQFQCLRRMEGECRKTYGPECSVQRDGML
jgi:hypothetical protein